MFKNRYVFIRNFVLLLIVCNTLYWYFPFRPLIWRLLLVFAALFVIANEKHRISCEKSILVFTALNVFYVLISFIHTTPTLTMIGNTLCAMLSLCLFTGLSERGVMTDSFITVAGLILFAAAIPYYYHTRIVTLEMLDADWDRDVTNNGSTLFLMLLPMVILMKNSIQKWVSFLICLFFIILSAKRGNILAAVIPSLLFAYLTLKDSKNSSFRVLLVFITISISGLFLYKWTINNDYLLYRLEQTAEGNSSMRDEIYAGAWNAWYYADSFVKQLFGYGYNATLSIPEMNHSHAHSDWLEILVDFGLLGVSLYFAVFITMIKQIRKTNTIIMKIALIAAILIWFSKSIYSMGFTEDNMPVLMITVGTVLGKNKQVVFK